MARICLTFRIALAGTVREDDILPYKKHEKNLSAHQTKNAKKQDSSAAGR